RAEPVDVKRHQQALTVVQVQVSHVLNVVAGVAGADGRQAARQPAEQVIDDRQVVRGQVPENVDVLLEQPQVDADAVDVVDLAQLAGGDQLFHLADGGAVEEGVVHH